jgi:predicted nuclease of predicted toxin-antitoxin system
MSGRFKLDENLPRAAEVLLRELGHPVETVLAECLGGRPDADVLKAANAEGRILVTLDLDFADIRRYPPSAYAGIWILRPRRQTIDDVLGLLRGALLVLETEPCQKRLWIVERERVRIHE